MTQGTKRILGIHLGLALAQLICVSAFAIELSRALHGNSLSWAYVFEWPIFSGYAIYMWQKLLKQERLGDATDVAAPDHGDDRALDDFNEYLRRVHDKTPPTAPPET